MPRKDKGQRKHGQKKTHKRSIARKQKNSTNPATKKITPAKQSTATVNNKLRPSIDVFEHLSTNADSLKINLEDVSISYKDDTFGLIQETWFDEFLDEDIAIDRIISIQYKNTILWDKDKKLDRIYGSGITKRSQLWEEIHNIKIHQTIDNTSIDKEFLHKIESALDNYNNDESNLKYLIVLDFEATCNDNKHWNQHYGTEIIEWPAMIIDIEKCEIVSNYNNISSITNNKRSKTAILNARQSHKTRFHYYIKPRSGYITPFCEKLTGITQNKINKIGLDISQVYKKWIDWCDDNQLTINNSCIVTCGSWDLEKCWIAQRQVCNWPLYNIIYQQNQENIGKILQIANIDETRDGALLLNMRWINIKQIYSQVMGRKAGGMMQMLDSLDVQHVGRHHSGIDDVKNTCQIVLKLIEKGAQPWITNQWTWVDNMTKRRKKTNGLVSSRKRDGNEITTQTKTDSKQREFVRKIDLLITQIDLLLTDI